MILKNIIPKNDKQLFITVILLSIMIYGALALNLGKDNTWDLRSYHYYIAHAFLNDRLGFDYAPAQFQTYLNPTTDLMFYFFVKWFPPKVVGFLMGGIQGLNFPLLFFIVFHSLRSFYQSDRNPKFEKNLIIPALFVTAVGLFGPTGISQIGRTLNDNLMSIFLLAAILLFVRNISINKVNSLVQLKRELIIAGFLIGISIGLKLTQTVYAIGFVVALIVFKDSWLTKLKAIAVIGFSIITGIILSGGHWMYQMWSKFESPIFPFYNKIFNSPYALDSNIIDVQYMPRSIIQTLFYPFFFFTDNHYTRPQETNDIRFAMIYLLFVLLGILWLRNRYFNRTEKDDNSRNDLIVNVLLHFNFFMVAVFPILYSRAIIIHRLTVQGLDEYLPIINFVVIVLFIISGFVIKQIIKSIDISKNIERNRPLSGDTNLVFRFILIFYLTSYIVWQMTFSVHRYLFTLELLSPLLIVILLIYLIKNRTYLILHTAMLFLIIMIVVERPSRDRLVWGDSYFEVQVPQYPQMEKSLILMASRDPLSYLIPFFPPEIRFLRIQRHFSFASTAVETLLMKEIKDIIKSHDGPIDLLARGRFLLIGEEAINKMGMSINRNETLIIKSISEPDDILLWKVERDE